MGHIFDIHISALKYREYLWIEAIYMNKLIRSRRKENF